MADFFDLREDGTVTIRPEAKQIPEVKAFLTKYPSEQANRLTQYIWHITSSKSPYEGYPPDKRELQVRKDFLKDYVWKQDEITKALINRYNEINDTPSKRLLRAARQAVEEIAQHMNSKQCDIDTKARLAEKLPKIVEGLDKCEERVKKEITTEEKLRGGGSSKLRER